MFRPFSPEILPGGQIAQASTPEDDLSHLRSVRTAQRCTAILLTAMVRDPELRVELPMVLPVFAVQA